MVAVTLISKKAQITEPFFYVFLNMKFLKVIKLFSINLLIFISLFIFAEFGIRVLFPGLQLYQRTYPFQFKDLGFDKNQTKVNWPKKDSLLGWVCSPDSLLKFSNTQYNKLDIKYTINKEGFRNSINFSEISRVKENKRILLLGDSFIMSVYLNEDQTITNELRKRLGKNFSVYNLGIPGYGIDQSILAYEKYQKIIDPDIVILFYIDDDISRVLESFRKVEGMNKPSFDLIEGKLTPRYSSQRGISISLMENSYLLNKFYKKYMDYYSIDLTENLFQRLINNTKSNKQNLVIVRCPVHENFIGDGSNEFYSFKEFFNANGTYYIELEDSLNHLSLEHTSKYFLENDGHPSKEGAEQFASKLKSIVLNLYENSSDN